MFLLKIGFVTSFVGAHKCPFVIVGFEVIHKSRGTIEALRTSCKGAFEGLLIRREVLLWGEGGIRGVCGLRVALGVFVVVFGIVFLILVLTVIVIIEVVTA